MDTRKLEQLYVNWPTEKLVEASVLLADEYDPSATALMRQVLDQRGVAEAEIESIAASLRPGRSHGRHLGDIRGWLLVFIVWSAATSIVATVTGLLALLGSDHWVRAVAAMVVIGIGGYGSYCATILVKRRADGPVHARRWLLAGALASMVAAALEYAVSGDWPPGSGRGVLFAALWIPYLSRSRRVACVYEVSPKGIEPS